MPSPRGRQVRTPGSTNRHTHSALMAHTHARAQDRPDRGPCTRVGARAFGDAGRGRCMEAVHSLRVVLRGRKGRRERRSKHCCRDVMYDSERFGSVEMIGRHTHTHTHTPQQVCFTSTCARKCGAAITVEAHAIAWGMGDGVTPRLPGSVPPRLPAGAVDESGRTGAAPS